MNFKDHFSSHAALYADTRPDYPAALFEFLVSQCQQRRLAWDCATGNGQAALSLSRYFQQVLATDASQEQLQEAVTRPNIEYRLLPAEEAPDASLRVDLVTVAQALHWLDTAAFFRCVDSVLQPGGLLAAWSYGLTSIEPAIDRIIHELYADILGPYWPTERLLVEQQYAAVDFPYTGLATPVFQMQLNWNQSQLLGYLSSWSATQRYITSQQSDPLDLVKEELARAWGSTAIKQISWPITLKLRRK